MTSKFSGFHKPNLVGISSSIPTIPFVTYHLQEQFIKTKKKKNNNNQTKERLSSRYTITCFVFIFTIL